MQGPGIHVENLNLRLGRNQVLRDMDFSVAAGSIHCLIGPNGGGKTSTLRCLLGQMPHQGTIRLDWHGEGRGIGYVPQLLEMERTLPLSVQDFLAVVSQDRPAFSGIHKAARGAIDAALLRVGLESKRGFLLGDLSGGERQRLLFAQALIPAPALLVLDEPMTSMDEAGMRVFEGLITELNDSGVTVLWVNHDMRLVRRMAHSLTVIDGTVLAHGPVDATLSKDMEAGAFPRQAMEGGR